MSPVTKWRPYLHIIALAENFEKVNNQYTHLITKLRLVWHKVIDMESPVRIELTTVC